MIADAIIGIGFIVFAQALSIGVMVPIAVAIVSISMVPSSFAGEVWQSGNRAF